MPCIPRSKTKRTSVDDCFEKKLPSGFWESDTLTVNRRMDCGSGSASCSRTDHLHTPGSSLVRLQCGALG